MFFAIVAGVFVLIPITAILTEHHRKMAEIRVRSGADAGRLAVLERRIAELTDVVHQQTIALDGRVGARELDRA